MAPNVLDAADAVRAAANLPTSARGALAPPRPGVENGPTPGWSVWETQSRSVPVPALRWMPRGMGAVETYEDMRRDPQIQGLLTSVFLPIRHMDWYLDPAGSPDGLAEEIAQDLGLPLSADEPLEDGSGVDFDEHLRLALLSLALGHQFFEEVGHIENDGAGHYRLLALEQRPPSTIEDIRTLSNGDLAFIRVPPSAAYVAANPTAIYADVPADHLLAYVWDREGANWAGRPLLYGLYRSWLLKDELIRGDANMKTRFAVIPWAETTQPSVGPDAHVEAAAMVQRARSGPTAGVAMPYGQRLRLAGIEGQWPDTIKSIEYHDAQMARAFMQMFAELGKVGSRALGATLMDHYALGVLAIANWIRKALMGLVRRIAVRNYGPGVVLPQIRFRADDHEDITITELVAAVDAELIVVDDELEATLRERANLPQRSGPGRTPPSTTAPAAAARRSRRGARKATAASSTAPSPAELSQTDFADLQATFETAVAAMGVAWATEQAAIIDELVTATAAATTVAAVAAIAAPLVTAKALADTLTALVDHGAQSVVSAAEAQGTALAAPDLTDTVTTVLAGADATTALLSRSLAQSAASHAVAQWGPDADPATVADQVREHLEGLQGSTVDYELAGLASRAQNEGRFAAMDGAPDATRFYASALNDSHRCEPCAVEDDQEFDSLPEARRDFPAGGYVGCQGGNRCRCTIVAVFPETEGQAA